MDQFSQCGLPVPWDHSLTTWLGQADLFSGLSFPSESEGFQSRWFSICILGFSPLKLKVGAHISRSLQAVSRKTKGGTSFRRAGSIPRAGPGGGTVMAQAASMWGAGGALEGCRVGRGEGLSLFRNPPQPQWAILMAGALVRSDGGQGGRLSGTAPRGRVGSTSRAGVALIQGKDVRGCDGGGREGRPHGKSLKLCACDAWGRHGWHWAPRCGADGGFSESRNAAPGGPRATAARGESPGNALRLAALPGSGQGPRPILLKYIRTR